MPRRRKVVIKKNLEEILPEDAELIKDIKQTCLEIAKTDAEAQKKINNKRHNLTIQNSKKWLKLTEGISEHSLIIYKNWKTQQQLKKPLQLPKVSISNLLVLLHVLKNSKNSPETDAEIRKYLQTAQRHSGIEPFWCSPGLMNAVFRQCILTRNWDKMALFCAGLLKQNFTLFDPYVRKMCRIMIKLNPLISKSGLQDQFILLVGINKTPF